MSTHFTCKIVEKYVRTSCEYTFSNHFKCKVWLIKNVYCHRHSREERRRIWRRMRLALWEKDFGGKVWGFLRVVREFWYSLVGVWRWWLRRWFEKPSWYGRRCNHVLDQVGRSDRLVLVFMLLPVGVEEVSCDVLRRFAELGNVEWIYLWSGTRWVYGGRGTSRWWMICVSVYTDRCYYCLRRVGDRWSLLLVCVGGVGGSDCLQVSVLSRCTY